jgi:ABC-2 type transport system permease protein
VRGVAFALRVVWINLWLQFKLLYIEGVIMTVVLPPVAHTTFMVLLIRHLDRPELAPYAVIGAAFLGAWGAAVNSAGTAVAQDRWTGTLELVFSSPAGAWLAMFGRVLFTSVLALAAVAETVILGRLLGLQLDVRDPVLLVAALVASLGSLAAAGLVAGSTFVLSGNMRLFTNLMVFPLVILSGAAFPIEVLPQVLRPISEIISLKWGADLLRASVGVGDVNVTLALTMMGLLTVAYIALGRAVFQVVDRRVRADGSLSSDE